MIRTKDLVEFINEWLLPNSNLQREYKLEIVVRLRERDELKKEVKELKSGKEA